MEPLKAEGFQFNSQAGAELLARMVANRNSRDEAAMLALIELGVPLAVARKQTPGFSGTPGLLVESASMDDDGHQFLRYAKDNHWGRVVAWVKEHRQG